MKNRINMFLMFIFGVICSGITVYAATQYLANDVKFTPSNSEWDVNNVEDALNYLYTKNNVNVWNNGNPLNLTLYNGCEIKQDDNKDYYLSFDGSDDYAQLDVLPATINWSDGFTIEFTAQWDSFNSWSRIFDFSNGADSDNIWVGNSGSSSRIVLAMRYGSTANYVSSLNSASFNTINLSEKVNVKIVTLKNNSNGYDCNYYINGELVGNVVYPYVSKNVERKINYLGKSAWTSDSYFKGRIYSLKIDQADGTNIIYININSIFK